ncbi:MAG: TIGR02147 family protein [Silvanigrellales bacterium]|nr:TIGR02147 family protein [Silvanigrellales bacterium]
MKPIYGSQSTAELLAEELERRQRRNPRYSLRSFARDLVIPPSLVSDVLAGKRHLAPSRVANVVACLRLTPMEAAFLEDLMQSEGARSKVMRHRAAERLERYRNDPPLMQLADDQFRSLSQWYHLALLEYLQLPERPHDHVLVAEAMGIEIHETVDALERLQRLGLVRRVKGRYLVDAKRSFFASSVPSQAVRDFHRGVLRQASAAIEGQKIDERELSASYFLMEQDHVEPSKSELREFREIFLRNRRNRRARPGAVYCLSMQLFRIAPSKPG